MSRGVICSSEHVNSSHKYGIAELLSAYNNLEHGLKRRILQTAEALGLANGSSWSIALGHKPAMLEGSGSIEALRRNPMGLPLMVLVISDTSVKL